MKKKFQKVLCMVLCMILVCMVVACKKEDSVDDKNKNDVENEKQEETQNDVQKELGGVVAHWKFQDDQEYYSGSIDKGDFTFKDLSGNGNHLQVKTEGNGFKYDVFSWVEGSTLQKDSKKALYFGNTYKNAKSVCPSDYNSADMEFTGGTYVSGKYFATVSDAPMNSQVFEEGYTIEIIFKVDSNFNMNYNRYVGIFSRQGIYNNEPWFSMALAETADINEEGYLKENGKLSLQLVQRSTDGSAVNKEFGAINTNQWVHYMAVSKNGNVTVYVNGQEQDTGGIHLTDIGKSKYGWEVGVGRKSFEGESVKNEEHEEGGIRRLFCGAISEIRVVDHAIDLQDALYRTSNSLLK